MCSFINLNCCVFRPIIESNPQDNLLIHDLDREAAEALLRNEVTSPSTIGYLLRPKPTNSALVLSAMICYPLEDDAVQSLYLGHHFDHEILQSLNRGKWKVKGGECIQDR